MCVQTRPIRAFETMLTTMCQQTAAGSFVITHFHPYAEPGVKAVSKCTLIPKMEEK